MLDEDDATDGQPATLPDYVAGLDADALDGTRIAVINNSDATYQAAIAKVQELGSRVGSRDRCAAWAVRES